jgi:predicted nucleic acid-binding protein
MNAVFLDTVGLLALWDTADQWHTAASAAYAVIVSKRQPFVTTTFVLMECGNAAARRPYRQEVRVLQQKLEQRKELIAPTEDDWKQAWEDYEQGKAGQAGIVDHTSFVVMRRLGLREAFTNDRHFQLAGFTVLF